MPNQAIIKNIIAGNAIATKQAIYESLSEKAFDLLEIKKVEVGSDIFDQQNGDVEDLEEEQLNELSKKTLGNYIKRASSSDHENSVSNLSSRAAYDLAKSNDDSDAGNKDDMKSYKRSKNISLAVNKITNEAFECINEEISDKAQELVLHADNDSHLYKSSHTPIVKNLEKKFKSGKYDHEKAKTLWKYHADRAADSYAKEHGSPGQKGHHLFSPTHRREAAKEFADYHKAEMEAGNFHS